MCRKYGVEFDVKIQIMENILQLQLRNSAGLVIVTRAYAIFITNTIGTKDHFYHYLSNAMTNVPYTESIFILVNFKPKCGAGFITFPTCSWYRGNGRTNVIWQRLRQFYTQHDRYVSNNIFSEHIQNDFIHRHHRQKETHEFCRILTESYNVPYITITRSTRVVDCDTDSSLARSTNKLKEWNLCRQNIHNSIQWQYNTWQEK